MALTEIEAIRLEIGVPVELMSDSELQYFLDNNSGNVKRASLDVARALLFRLAQFVRQRTSEIEQYASDYFKNYMEALKLYISDPNLNSKIQFAMPYAGGVSRSDVRENIATFDNLSAEADKAFPTDGEAAALRNDNPFERPVYPIGPFSV